MLPIADPYDVYERAREVWAAQRYPAHVAYDIAVRVRENGATLEERYAARFDADTGIVDVDPTSDYERTHAPTGSGVRIQGMGGPSSAAVDFIGVPQLAPNYSFGIWRYVPRADAPASDMDVVRQIREEFHDPAPRPLPTSTATGTIATVTARNRAYDITVVGSEAIDGRTCTHLAMRPLSSADVHRLRDLWIDQRDGATVRAYVSQNFTTGAGSAMSWSIDFQTIGGAQYVSREVGTGMWKTYRRGFDRVEIAFEHIHATAAPRFPHPFAPQDLLTEP